MPELTLEQADAMANAAIAWSRDRKMEPISVVVVDEGGNVIVSKRDNESGFFYIEMAKAKAWGSVAVRRPTGAQAKRFKSKPEVSVALTVVSGGRRLAVEGGVLILNPARRILGAIGIAGDRSPRAEECAVAAVKTVDLVPDIVGHDPLPSYDSPGD